MTEREMERWAIYVGHAKILASGQVGLVVPEGLLLTVNAELEALRDELTAMIPHQSAAQEEIATLRTSLARHLEVKQELGVRLREEKKRVRELESRLLDPSGSQRD